MLKFFTEATSETTEEAEKEDSPQLEEEAEKEVKPPTPIPSEEENIKDAWDETSSEEEEEVAPKQNGPKKVEIVTSTRTKQRQSDSESESDSSESSSEESDSEEESYSSSESEGDGKKDEASIMERIRNRIHVWSLFFYMNVMDFDIKFLTCDICLWC